MSRKSHKVSTTIRLDEEKWSEISRRIPGVTLSSFIDRVLNDYLNMLIERDIEIEIPFDYPIGGKDART